MKSLLFLIIVLILAKSDVWSAKPDVSILRDNKCIKTTLEERYGRKIPPNNSSAQYFFLHSHKAGGQTLNRELKYIFKNNEYWCQSEGTYDKNVYDSKIFDQNRTVNVIMFLRQPLNQIISSYNMLKVNEDKQFNKSNKAYNYNCTNSTWKCNLDECSLFDDCLNSLLARKASTRNIGESNYYDFSKKFWFIGITEYYYTSLCMLRYKLGYYSHEICDCHERNASKIIHDDHGLPHYYTHISNHTKHYLLSHLHIDLKLYEIAYALFKYEVHTLELQSGIKFFCDSPINR